MTRPLFSMAYANFINRSIILFTCSFARWRVARHRTIIFIDRLLCEHLGRTTNERKICAHSYPSVYIIIDQTLETSIYLLARLKVTQLHVLSTDPLQVRKCVNHEFWFVRFSYNDSMYSSPALCYTYTGSTKFISPLVQHLRFHF